MTPTPFRAMAALVVVGAAQPAFAEDKPAFTLSAAYTADIIDVSARDIGSQTYYLDDLQIFADGDLDRLVGWRGGSFHVEVLNNLGGMPNNRAATLQGVDNIEVSSQRLRLFEAWFEQSIGHATTLRAGLYDLNSEFYANDAASGLIAPAFGVGSEIAATGTNGPSIFPSSALAIRLNAGLGKRGYVRAAAINANASTFGDTHGVDFSFSNGALLIAEAGIEGRSKFSVGGWGYTRRQDDIRAVDASGAPVRRGAYGGYAIAEVPMWGKDGAAREVHGFLRVGVSEGKTTAFKGGWQGGFMIKRPLAARPDGVLSIGANQGYLSNPYRRNLSDVGTQTTAAESAIEITYSDQILKHVSVQPDLQWVFAPAGERGRDTVLVIGIRFSISS